MRQPTSRRWPKGSCPQGAGAGPSMWVQPAFRRSPLSAGPREAAGGWGGGSQGQTGQHSRVALKVARNFPQARSPPPEKGHLLLY